MLPPIGLFFGSSTGNSETVARMIVKEFSPCQVDVFDLMYFKSYTIPSYTCYIFGIPTWDRQKIHEDWHEFLPILDTFDLAGKQVALYGLGDQTMYSGSFVNSLGILYEYILNRNAKIVGSWPLESYSFKVSGGIRNNKFVGLVIDEDRQTELTRHRVKKWVNQLKDEFSHT